MLHNRYNLVINSVAVSDDYLYEIVARKHKCIEFFDDLAENVSVNVTHLPYGGFGVTVFGIGVPFERVCDSVDEVLEILRKYGTIEMFQTFYSFKETS